MKELLLKIKNKTFLIVETPEKIIEIKAKNNQAKTETIYLMLFNKKNLFYSFPIEHKGLVQFVCHGDEITQSIAHKMMSYVNEDKWLQENYLNYLKITLLVNLGISLRLSLPPNTSFWLNYIKN